MTRVVADEIITRIITVDRTRTPQQVLDATGRCQHNFSNVAATMPANGTGVERNVTVRFLKLRKAASNYEADQLLEQHGLKSDPYAVAAVNEADSAFALEHKNVTHWQDKDGNWCWAVFYEVAVYRPGNHGLHVQLDRKHRVWCMDTWLGGVPKSVH